MNLYITADSVASETSGGSVTCQESTAMNSLGKPFDIWGREQLPGDGPDPWKWDSTAHAKVSLMASKPKLAHFYAGTFSKTVDALKRRGCKVTYTAAAHDINISRKEHRKLGLEFAYPHLNEPALWKRYVAGYLESDYLICPSTLSASIMEGYGAKSRIAIIPHGVDLPETIAVLPSRFTVGYIGALGPDKGVIYLLQAWRELAYKDAMLVIAGRDSLSPFMMSLLDKFGGGAVCLTGWQSKPSDFYNSITVYVQPSASEGFGMPVLEAMAHGRVALCSRGAGACDVVRSGHTFSPMSVDALAMAIDDFKKSFSLTDCQLAREKAAAYSWENIRGMYVKLWKDLCP